ncbi:gamma-glutamyltransferase family protein [uncultured Tateyamaria sp.]|uniref:gamma-glutamyltransferase family protein n=1 Tax=uncultured Tateyamaria sp. TaxID=455651 RepID=UPI00261A0A7D|nr:gamma-glutamyltransferase family protein [uncultured Tateyamaria sp.]
MTFTTRPELSGTFGMVTSTHWLASAVGLKLLEAGGTAFDAAAGVGFVLNVVEPHLNGLLGDMPAILRVAGEDPVALCGQGVAPAGATIEHYRDAGLDLIPGSGLLATVVPGAFDAWMLMLRDHGRLPLRDILAPAIHYARAGHPVLPRVANTIAGQAAFFAAEWPTSAEVWTPGGKAPAAGTLFANPQLADVWDQLAQEADAAPNRVAGIDAARRAFASGFVAERIDTYMSDACVMDGTGERRRGVLTGDDMAQWSASYEPTVSVDHHGWQVHKCGPWTQGPVLLQCLQMLRNDPLAEMDPNGPDFVHLVTEALKRGFADREVYYGDPDHADIPLAALLSDAHADAHRADITDQATHDHRPGVISGYEIPLAAYHTRAGRVVPQDTGTGGGEPTMAHLTNRKGDTVHIDVVDQWGNMVSATPSGGWLQSNPVVPGLGAPLNSRAQMFWLTPGLPTSLAPGRRPRTTLSPSMALHADGRALAFGTPGGDQQDQWQLAFFLRHVHHGMNLQEAIDAPLFHTGHLQASFYPRGMRAGHLMAEPHFAEATLDALRAKGHALEVAEPWTVGRLTAAQHAPDGLVKAAATPRLMQAYAMGR